MQRRMTRVYVISSQHRRDELVRALQRLGVLHIDPVQLTDRPTSSQELSAERHDAEVLLLQVRGLRDLLAPPPDIPAPTYARLDLAQTREHLQRLEEQVRSAIVERRQLQERLEAATSLKYILDATQALLQEIATPPSHELIIGLGSSPLSPEEIAQFLEQTLPGRCVVRLHALPADRWELVVSVDALYAAAVREYLGAKGVRPLALPAHIPSNLSLAEAIAHLQRDLKEAPIRLREIDAKLHELGQAHGAELLALERALVNRIAQLDAMARFGYTAYALVISGWIPHEEFEPFARRLQEQFPEVIVREDPQPAPPHEIPVALHNNSWSRPYELFLSIMGMPKYGTIDPVPFISFFFPLFFGIIVGDIGYGAVIGLLGFWLRRRFAHSNIVRQASQIVIHCAFSTIVFGAIFAELFGFILPYPHLKRGEQTNALLLFTVALGATQILLGFLLGAINAFRERHNKHALAKLAAIGALLGLGLTIGALAGQLPDALKTPSFALLAAAMVLLVLSEGFLGVLELVSYVGNIISYARLMGFGLVGLKIAEVINELGHALHNIFLAVLIGIAAHAANLGLAIFEATVQSARLHYVEFFGKFLELGGRKYEPFREI
ncbi:MAG: hypothetical protein NZ930_05950 [Candidatus Bipolaricaulota bacterium]|nr:hypothetical protein [Candidatus Bipolaricaulota bacterium]MDW8030458.1 V-type ATPase 116kDa subunit family protein [Candidatus Bipolaricaulota bacterium]